MGESSQGNLMTVSMHQSRPEALSCQDLSSLAKRGGSVRSDECDVFCCPWKDDASPRAVANDDRACAAVRPLAATRKDGIQVSGIVFGQCR